MADKKQYLDKTGLDKLTDNIKQTYQPLGNYVSKDDEGNVSISDLYVDKIFAKSTNREIIYTNDGALFIGRDFQSVDFDCGGSFKGSLGVSNLFTDTIIGSECTIIDFDGDEDILFLGNGSENYVKIHRLKDVSEISTRGLTVNEIYNQADNCRLLGYDSSNAAILLGMDGEGYIQTSNIKAGGTITSNEVNTELLTTDNINSSGPRLIDYNPSSNVIFLGGDGEDYVRTSNLKVTGTLTASDVVKELYLDTEHLIIPNKGRININPGDGINFIKDSNNEFNISADPDYLATREYVDSVKTSILGSDALNESYDTLQEVAEWIESHSGEAAGIITDINGINTKMKDLLGYSMLITNEGVLTSNTDSISVAFSTRNINSDLSYRQVSTELFHIYAATTTTAGVMSATDKINLDNTVEEVADIKETKADKSEVALKANDKELDKAIFGDELIDLDTELEGVSRDELKKDLFIDMWETCSPCCSYNRTTKFFEVDYGDGYKLDDLTLEDALLIYKYGCWESRESIMTISANSLTFNTIAPQVRGTIPSIYTKNSIIFHIDWTTRALEIVKYSYSNEFNDPIIRLSNSNHLDIYGRSKHFLDWWLPENAIRISNPKAQGGWVETFYVYKVTKNITIDMPSLSLKSVKFMVDNAANTTPITATMENGLYLALTGNAESYPYNGGTREEWNAVLQSAIEKQITFATI